MRLEIDIKDLSIIYEELDCQIIPEDHMDGSPIEYFLDYITGSASFLYTELESKRKEVEIENDELVTSIVLVGSKEMVINEISVIFTPNYMVHDGHIIYIDFGLEWNC